MAQASPVRKCGHSAAVFRGYEGFANITSRNVACPSARVLALDIAGMIVYRNYDQSRQAHTTRLGPWTVRMWWYRTGPFYAMDVQRTASGGRVVRFQFAGE
jgi:hypothetical protein